MFFNALVTKHHVEMSITLYEYHTLERYKLYTKLQFQNKYKQSAACTPDMSTNMCYKHFNELSNFLHYEALRDKLMFHNLKLKSSCITPRTGN